MLQWNNESLSNTVGVHYYIKILNIHSIDNR